MTAPKKTGKAKARVRAKGRDAKRVRKVALDIVAGRYIGETEKNLKWG